MKFGEQFKWRLVTLNGLNILWKNELAMKGVVKLVDLGDLVFCDCLHF